MDGTNIRVGWDLETVKFGGRTDNAQIPATLIEVLQKLFPLEKFKKEYPETPMILYGEGYGAKIQKGGGNYRLDQGFVLFDIKIDEWWLKRESIIEIATALEIYMVPVIGTGTLPLMVGMAEKGFNSYWGNFQAEGIVARPKVELKNRSGRRIITKIKHKDFKEQK